MRLVLLAGNNSRDHAAPYGDAVVRILRANGGHLRLFQLSAGLCLMGIGARMAAVLAEVLGLPEGTVDDRWCAAQAVVTVALSSACPVALAVDPDASCLYAVLCA